jgi:hypothetical protein
MAERELEPLILQFVIDLVDDEPGQVVSADMLLALARARRAYLLGNKDDLHLALAVLLHCVCARPTTRDAATSPPRRGGAPQGEAPPW